MAEPKFAARHEMNRDQILKIVSDHRETLAGDFGVKSLALFGSVVRDEATAASDVDLLVEFDGRPVGWIFARSSNLGLLSGEACRSGG